MWVDVHEEFKQSSEYNDALQEWIKDQDYKQCWSCNEYYEQKAFKDTDGNEYDDCYQCRAIERSREINAGEDNRIAS